MIRKMKSTTVFDRIMHFLLHNSFLFTAIIMGFVHLVLLGITWYADVTPLANFNVLSVVVYLFCVILCKNGHILPVYISIFIEVSVYAVLSVYYIGWGCGSYFFLFSIVPIVIYFGNLIFRGTKKWLVVALLTVIFAIYVFLYIRFDGVAPVYAVSDTIRIILTTFATFAMFFSVIFYNGIYIIASESEMTNLEEKNEQLSVDAQADALTGLLNRRGFLPVISALMNNAGSNHFCIAFGDIDNFKRINDTYGHDCGDEVLRHISSLIKKEMHGCEICRWGGEEFIILMRDYDFNVAKHKMEYLRKYIESTPTTFFNQHISATVTIGLEEYRDIYKEPDDIIKIADERMYYGKQHGKNIVIYENMG